MNLDKPKEIDIDMFQCSDEVINAFEDLQCKIEELQVSCEELANKNLQLQKNFIGKERGNKQTLRKLHEEMARMRSTKVHIARENIMKECAITPRWFNALTKTVNQEKIISDLADQMGELELNLMERDHVITTLEWKLKDSEATTAVLNADRNRLGLEMDEMIQRIEELEGTEHSRKQERCRNGPFRGAYEDETISNSDRRSQESGMSYSDRRSQESGQSADDEAEDSAPPKKTLSKTLSPDFQVKHCVNKNGDKTVSKSKLKFDEKTARRKDVVIPVDETAATANEHSSFSNIKAFGKSVDFQAKHFVHKKESKTISKDTSNFDEETARPSFVLTAEDETSATQNYAQETPLRELWIANDHALANFSGLDSKKDFKETENENNFSPENVDRWERFDRSESEANLKKLQTHPVEESPAGKLFNHTSPGTSDELCAFTKNDDVSPFSRIVESTPKHAPEKLQRTDEKLQLFMPGESSSANDPWDSPGASHNIEPKWKKFSKNLFWEKNEDCAKYPFYVPERDKEDENVNNCAKEEKLPLNHRTKIVEKEECSPDRGVIPHTYLVPSNKALISVNNEPIINHQTKNGNLSSQSPLQDGVDVFAELEPFNDNGYSNRSTELRKNFSFGDKSISFDDGSKEPVKPVVKKLSVKNLWDFEPDSIVDVSTGETIYESGRSQESTPTPGENPNFFVKVEKSSRLESKDIKLLNGGEGTDKRDGREGEERTSESSQNENYPTSASERTSVRQKYSKRSKEFRKRSSSTPLNNNIKTEFVRKGSRKEREALNAYMEWKQNGKIGPPPVDFKISSC